MAAGRASADDRDVSRLGGRTTVAEAQLLGEAVAEVGPTALRYPKGPVPAEIPAVDKMGSADVLYASQPGISNCRVLLVGVGPMAGVAMAAARLLVDQGVGVTVVDPRWVKPLDPALAQAAGTSSLVAVVEDHGHVGGVADAVSRLLRDAGVNTPLRAYAIPQEFLSHDSREHLLDTLGLNPSSLADNIRRATTDLNDAESHMVAAGHAEANVFR